MSDALEKLYKAIKTEEFQLLQDNLAKSSDLAIITVDYKGRPLSAHSECNDFCSHLRRNPEYAKLCEKCDSHGGLEAARLKEPFIYICHAGIIDVAVPIIINDMYLGGIMAGQVKLNPNETSVEIEQIYKQTDLDQVFVENPSLKADYEKMPVLSYHKVEATAKILQTICKFVVQNPSEKLLNELLTTVDQVARTEKNSNQMQEDLLKPAILYIEEHYKDKISLKQLAQVCNVSESYFSRLFPKCFGKNMTQYINEIRILKSKSLLSNPDLTINHIANSCGYEDTSYYIKCFKKMNNITPHEYRSALMPS